MTRTTIVLADDHPVVREGVRALLEREPDFRVVGETGDGLAVADLVERLQPSVLLLDLVMPSLNGLEVTRQVRTRAPGTRVVVLSMYATEAHVLEALRNGAVGYVVKGAMPSEIVQAVREAAAGRRYLSPPLSDRAIEAYVESARAAPFDPYETLSTREREVLQLAAEGHGNRDVAARLGISPRTVETHRANVMRKLALGSQVDLVRYALQRGILTAEPRVRSEPDAGRAPGAGDID